MIRQADTLEGPHFTSESLASSEEARYREIIKQSLDERETLVKEARRLKDNCYCYQVRDKVEAVKMENIAILEEIRYLEEAVEESGRDHFSKPRSNEQQDTLLQRIEGKYQESLRLEIEVKELEQVSQPTKQQQKTRNTLLQQLMVNEQSLEQYQQQLTHLRQQNQDTLWREKQHETSMETQLEEIRHRIQDLKEKFQYNRRLLQGYQRTYSPHQDNPAVEEMKQMLTRLAFGDNRELTLEGVEAMCQKYKEGLLVMLNDLAGVIFGNEPSLEKIRELKESLQGKALLDWFCQKNRSRDREAKFLQEKEAFILEFQKQIESLARHWEDQKESQLQHKKRVEELETNKSREEEELRQRLSSLTNEHHRAIKRELQEHLSTLNEVSEEIEVLQGNKDRLTSEVSQLKEEKVAFEKQKAQLTSLEREIGKKRLELHSLGKRISTSTEQYQAVLKSVSVVTEKENLKLGHLLHLEAEFKIINSKLSILRAEHSSKSEELQHIKASFSSVQALLRDQERILNRTKASVITASHKLQNLSKLFQSQKRTHSSPGELQPTDGAKETHLSDQTIPGRFRLPKGH